MIVIPEKWIRKPDESGNGLLEVEAEGRNAEFPMPVETHHVALEDVTPGEQQDFEMILEAASPNRVYADEAEYDERKDSSFAAESFVPAGLFSPTEDPGFVPSGQAIIHGRVIKTYEDPTQFGFSADDTIFTMTCLGYEFDVYVPYVLADKKPVKVGNIVTGMYWIQGWPKED